MDYRRENSFSSGNVVQILTGNPGNVQNDNWGTDQAMWATEADYGVGNREDSADTQLANETPNIRSRNSQSDLTGPIRSKAIGKMFYKTKLCCKFRAGTCPYVTNCNFAHSIEELRKPPPNWQEIVAAHDEERGVSSEPPREEFQIPIFGVSDESQRSGKGRHCKRFFTEEGCPYGENCTFLHDEHSKTRESVAISLGPGVGGGYAVNVNESTLKPSNWKTRICNKWELTGYCPFGAKCHFAHGAAELHGYGGGQLDTDAKDSSIPEQGAPPAKTSVDHSINQMGIQSQRLSNVIQKTERTHKWKGPDKISKIYGDWIDDL